MIIILLIFDDRSLTLQTLLVDPAFIASKVISLYKSLPVSVPPEDLRGIGIHITRLQNYDHQTSSSSSSTTTTTTLTSLFSNNVTKQPAISTSIKSMIEKETSHSINNNTVMNINTNDNMNQNIIDEIEVNDDPLDAADIAATMNNGGNSDNDDDVVEIIQVNSTQKHEKDSKLYAIPSYSQIDLEVLIQLPENTKQNIKNHRHLPQENQQTSSHKKNNHLYKNRIKTLESFFELSHQKSLGRRKQNTNLHQPQQQPQLQQQQRDENIDRRRYSYQLMSSSRIEKTPLSPLLLTQQVSSLSLLFFFRFNANFIFIFRQNF